MTGSEKFLLSRCSGTNNTFLIADSINSNWKNTYPFLSKEQKEKIAKNLCSSFHGFKTDGLLFLYNFEKYDFAWDFFNSDGSFAEMCGNAARCASWYFYKRIDQKKIISFFSGAGDINAEILEEEMVKIEMPKISPIQSMSVLGKPGIFIDTGVPHFVLEMAPERKLAQQLRTVDAFGKTGSNITFVENVKSESVSAVTFERGVEDYTEACGTGAVAAAAFCEYKIKKLSKVAVKMPGGTLYVDGAKSNQRPFLSGSAKIEFDLLIDKNRMMGN
jgi:diaminopimelate epimerase